VEGGGGGLGWGGGGWGGGGGGGGVGGGVGIPSNRGKVFIRMGVFRGHLGKKGTMGGEIRQNNIESKRQKKVKIIDFNPKKVGKGGRKWGDQKNPKTRILHESPQEGRRRWKSASTKKIAKRRFEK